MSKLSLLDLFSGIGGFSEGLERSGHFRTVAFAEPEVFPKRALAAEWPGVPIYDDVRDLSAERLAADGIRRINAICGGFPCQDISNANAAWGGQLGLDGERSGLWSHYARIIGEFRPDLVFVENSAALLGRGLERVLGDLAALGYDAEWHCIPASAVGAPHDRDRIWIVADTLRIGLERGAKAVDDHAPRRPILSRSSFARALGESEPNGSRWADEPALARVADGVQDRAACIKALGNAVVPLIPEILGRVFGPLALRGMMQ